VDKLLKIISFQIRFPFSVRIAGFSEFRKYNLSPVKRISESRRSLSVTLFRRCEVFPDMGFLDFSGIFLSKIGFCGVLLFIEGIFSDFMGGES